MLVSLCDNFSLVLLLVRGQGRHGLEVISSESNIEI